MLLIALPSATPGWPGLVADPAAGLGGVWLAAEFAVASAAAALCMALAAPDAVP